MIELRMTFDSWIVAWCMRHIPVIPRELRGVVVLWSRGKDIYLIAA